MAVAVRPFRTHHKSTLTVVVRVDTPSRDATVSSEPAKWPKHYEVAFPLLRRRGEA